MTHLPLETPVEEVEQQIEYYDEESLMALLNIRSRGTLRRLVKNGGLPKPIDLSRSVKRWPRQFVHDYLMDKALKAQD